MKYQDFLGKAFNEKDGQIDMEEMRNIAIADKDKFNIFLCGVTGAGKSTLINAIFGADVVKTGSVAPVTQNLNKVEVKEKGMILWDTKGIEAKAYKETIDGLKEQIREALDDAQDSNSLPHLAWICINTGSARFEDRDIDLLKIMKDYEIPIVVVFTRVIGKDNIKFVEEAKKIISEKFPSLDQNSYASVNSVEYVIDEDISIKPKGLDELIKVSEGKFPDGAKAAERAFLKAQKVKMEKRLESMKDGASRVVHIASAAAGTAGASPIPGSDAPIIAAIQSAMIYKINAEFEIDANTSRMTSIITGIMGVTALAQIGKTVVSNALKFIPGAGTLIGGAISASTAIALTEAVGHAYIKAIESFYDMKTGAVELPSGSGVILDAFKDYFSLKK